MKTIEISEQVWKALQDISVPLVDKPDDVLRRILGIDPAKKQTEGNMGQTQSTADVNGSVITQIHRLFRAKGF